MDFLTRDVSYSLLCTVTKQTSQLFLLESSLASPNLGENSDPEHPKLLSNRNCRPSAFLKLQCQLNFPEHLFDIPFSMLEKEVQKQSSIDSIEYDTQFNFG